MFAALIFSLDLSYKQSVLGSVQYSQGTNGTWRAYVARGAAPASGGWRAVRVGGQGPLVIKKKQILGVIEILKLH